MKQDEETAWWPTCQREALWSSPGRSELWCAATPAVEVMVVVVVVVAVVAVIETVTMLYTGVYASRQRTHAPALTGSSRATAPSPPRLQACDPSTFQQPGGGQPGGSARGVSQGRIRGQTFQHHLANHWQIHFHHRAAVAHVRKRSCMPVFKRLHGGGGGGGWSVVADVLCNQVADVTTHLSRVSDV